MEIVPSAANCVKMVCGMVTVVLTGSWLRPVELNRRCVKSPSAFSVRYSLDQSKSASASTCRVASPAGAGAPEKLKLSTFGLKTLPCCL